MSIIPYAMDMAKTHHTQKTFDHVLRVATYVAQNRMIPYEQRDFCFALALMHDLLEDTDYPRGALSGSVEVDSKRFERCLELLTKPKEQDYNEYVSNIKMFSGDYPEAYWVKLADMKDHLEQKETLTDALKEKYLNSLPYLL